MDAKREKKGGDLGMVKQFEEDIWNKMREQNKNKIIEIFKCCECGSEIEVGISYSFVAESDNSESFGKDFVDKVSLEVLHNNFTCKECQKSYVVSADKL